MAAIATSSVTFFLTACLQETEVLQHFAGTSLGNVPITGSTKTPNDPFQNSKCRTHVAGAKGRKLLPVKRGSPMVTMAVPHCNRLQPSDPICCRSLELLLLVDWQVTLRHSLRSKKRSTNQSESHLVIVRIASKHPKLVCCTTRLGIPSIRANMCDHRNNQEKHETCCRSLLKTMIYGSLWLVWWYHWVPPWTWPSNH